MKMELRDMKINIRIRQMYNSAKNMKTTWSGPYGGNVRVFTFRLAITKMVKCFIKD